MIEAFPNAEALLALEPEELGDVILELIHAGIAPNPPMFSKANFLQAMHTSVMPDWPQGTRPQVTEAVSEAMAYLESAGLIIPDPTQPHGTSYYCLTRRGRQLENRNLAAAYRASAILPVALVHPEILKKAQDAFMRGDHDIAVFAAFKAVEVAVRKAGGYEEGELGCKLMRKAFESESGPLADMTVESGERKAQADLFAGAIGAAKNPASHRDVEMSKIEAARLILLASYLMSIVETRGT